MAGLLDATHAALPTCAAPPSPPLLRHRYCSAHHLPHRALAVRLPPNRFCHWPPLPHAASTAACRHHLRGRRSCAPTAAIVAPLLPAAARCLSLPAALAAPNACPPKASAARPPLPPASAATVAAAALQALLALPGSSPLPSSSCRDLRAQCGAVSARGSVMRAKRALARVGRRHTLARQRP